MGCGKKCLQIALITVNVIFFLAGAAVLGVGLWVRFDENGIKKFADANGLEELVNSLYYAAYVLIAVGGFTFVVGFCGCYGAVKSNKCLIGVYIALVLAILGAEIGGGVYVYANKETLIKNVETEGKKFLKNDYGTNNASKAKESWDEVMKNFNCCGVSSPKDFALNNVLKNSRYYVPQACCKKDESGRFVDEMKCLSPITVNHTAFVNEKGCSDKLQDLIMNNSAYLLGVAGGVAGFELLVVVMAICFCCSIDKY